MFSEMHYLLRILVIEFVTYLMSKIPVHSIFQV